MVSGEVLTSVFGFSRRRRRAARPPRSWTSSSPASSKSSSTLATPSPNTGSWSYLSCQSNTHWFTHGPAVQSTCSFSLSKLFCCRCMLVFQTLVETLGAEQYLWMIPVLVMESAARHKHAAAPDDQEWVSTLLHPFASRPCLGSCIKAQIECVDQLVAAFTKIGCLLQAFWHLFVPRLPVIVSGNIENVKNSVLGVFSPAFEPAEIDRGPRCACSQRPEWTRTACSASTFTNSSAPAPRWQH